MAYGYGNRSPFTALGGLSAGRGGLAQPGNAEAQPEALGSKLKEAMQALLKQPMADDDNGADPLAAIANQHMGG
jgi:hypothetical protein